MVREESSLHYCFSTPCNSSLKTITDFVFRSFRLHSKRPLKKLLMNSDGCNQRSAGIGDIAYVKDLMTERIVTSKLRCSTFGLGQHHLARFGWVHRFNYYHL